MRLGDAAITEGEPIALIDDVLVLSAASAEDALLNATTELAPPSGAVLTLYYGREVTPERAEGAVAQLHARFPCAEIESRSGGQPFYDYILSLE